MEIHSLKVSLSEQELNELAAEAPPGKSAVENLSVRLTPEGIVVSGAYPIMFMKVGFETLWQVKGAGSIVEARLANITVSGLPAGKLRGVLIKTLRDLLEREPGVRVTDEAIHVDLSKLTALKRLQLRVHLTGVYCTAGHLIIESGPALV
jgi:hypothetical protein